MEPFWKSWLDGASARDARLNRRVLKLGAANAICVTLATWWITGAPFKWSLNVAAAIWGGMNMIYAVLPCNRSDGDKQQYVHPFAKTAYNLLLLSLIPPSLWMIYMGIRECYLYMSTH